jgi:DNA transformation protein
MPRDDGLLAHLRELLEPLGRITLRAMFGGHGVYCDGVFFALVAEDQLYLKVDALTRDLFAAAGCAPFVYAGQARPIEMSYWSVPDAALDSPEAIEPWARLALAAAARKPPAKSATGPVSGKRRR